MSSNKVTITEDFRGNMTLESSRVITNLRPAEVSALRAHFAAERMPEDVADLTQRAYRIASLLLLEEYEFEDNAIEVPALLNNLAAALEAAYSQKGAECD